MQLILHFLFCSAKISRICVNFLVHVSVETGSGHPGLTRFIIYPGLTRFIIYPGLTRFIIYPGLTRIGSREKRNCSFDDVETYKRYRVPLS